MTFPLQAGQFMEMCCRASKRHLSVSCLRLAQSAARTEPTNEKGDLIGVAFFAKWLIHLGNFWWPGAESNHPREPHQ